MPLFRGPGAGRPPETAAAAEHIRLHLHLQALQLLFLSSPSSPSSLSLSRSPSSVMASLVDAVDIEPVSVDLATVPPENLERFRAVFTQVDTDGNGTIDISELKILFSLLGITCSDEELSHLIKIVDVDHSGSLSFEEFVTLICLLADAHAKAQHRADLKLVFDSVDTDGSGSICIGELGEMFQKLGYETTLEELTQLIQHVDADGNGSLDFEEFLALMDIFLSTGEEEGEN